MSVLRWLVSMCKLQNKQVSLCVDIIGYVPTVLVLIIKLFEEPIYLKTIFLATFVNTVLETSKLPT